MSLPRDTLFILAAPFVDPDLEGEWLCRDCAMMEGALLVNAHWAQAIDVRRMAYRPRPEIVALIGADNQSMPVLVLADDAQTNEDARVANGQRFLTDTKAILRYLAAAHGGAGPHP